MAKKTSTKRAATEIDAYVGSRIRAARNALSISQGALAEKLGMSFQQVQKYEKGMNRVSCGALVIIAAALDVQPSWFFEGAPGTSSKANKSITVSTKFFATSGAAGLADDFMRLNPRDRRVVGTLAHQLTH